MTDTNERFMPHGPFPLFMKDLKEDTMGWTEKERWNYLTILDHLYHQGGIIPDDNNYLCEVMALRKGRGYLDLITKIRSKLTTIRDSKAVANAFESHFLTLMVFNTKGVWLTQKRVIKEVENAQKRSAKARLGGEAKAVKDRAPSTNDNLLGGVLPSPSPYSLPKGKGEIALFGLNDKSDFDGADNPVDSCVNMVKQSGKSEQVARNLVGKWRKEAGTDDALAGLLANSADKIDPVSWISAATSGIYKSSKSSKSVNPAVGSEAARQAQLDGYGFEV